ncbi:MAG: NAD(P)-binding domain-containing protein [Akkermansiaceae bacterium]
MKPRRLAIIGAGSSGLVTLKNAIDRLPDWEIVCYEKGTATIGCWGNPYPGFVSTSTKYTTQFTSFVKWDCEADPANRPTKSDFFLGDEYGRYLNDFADHFGLRKHIQLETAVRKIRKVDGRWTLSIDHHSTTRDEQFDKLIICTGLVTNAKHIETDIPLLKYGDPPPSDSTILVLGAGESGADIAHRLAEPSLKNQIYLSLKTGVRVSPRYHPIRGVPSDFLRNRLMLSIHRDLRNRIGQKFVEARIRHQELFESIFGGKSQPSEKPTSTAEKRKHWDAKLTARAKDELFNVFHTKSDDFLDDVAEDRIKIIGPPVDDNHRKFTDFDGDETVEIEPDYICQMIGFSSGLEQISDGEICLQDFYEGCAHVSHDDLFLVGFTRPIIGNIPTISEMQAKYVTGLIAGEFDRPEDIEQRHAAEQKEHAATFKNLNTKTIRPVEMFPYCDRLARMMDCYPTRRKIGSTKAWIKTLLAPASTMHYVDSDHDPKAVSADKIHSPIIITSLLVLIKALQKPLLWIMR